MQLTDAQVFTLACAIIFPAAALIYSNSRVGDVNKRIDALDANLGKRLDERFESLKEVMRSELSAIRNEIVALKAELKADLKIHVLEHHK